MDHPGASGIQRKPDIDAAAQASSPLAPAFPHQLTWAQWQQWQAQHTPVVRNTSETPDDCPPPHATELFTDRELARLTFLRWLVETGRLTS